MPVSVIIGSIREGRFGGAVVSRCRARRPPGSTPRDGFVFVTTEYNHTLPASAKATIDQHVEGEPVDPHRCANAAKRLSIS